MQKQRPEQESPRDQTSPKQLRLLGFLMIVIGPLILAIGFATGFRDVNLGVFHFEPPLSIVAIFGLAIASFAGGIALVWGKLS